MNFIEALKYLYFNRPYGKIKLGLYRIEELLKRLNNPEKSFKSVHITGSITFPITTGEFSLIIPAFS